MLLSFLFCYRKFFDANRALPSKIIIYRDGVGSGDIARLKEKEIAAVKVGHFNFEYIFVYR